MPNPDSHPVSKDFSRAYRHVGGTRNSMVSRREYKATAHRQRRRGAKMFGWAHVDERDVDEFPRLTLITGWDVW